METTQLGCESRINSITDNLFTGIEVLVLAFNSTSKSKYNTTIIIVYFVNGI